jgi:superfamily I DNA and/or RNA helicase
MAEVQAVTACVKALIESGDVGKDGSGIGVITPYSAQARALCDAIQSSHPLCEVKTVDAYQGREKEIIIISTVRSNERGSVGFLADWRRLNVAITRGRRGIITFGDPRTLAKDINWAAYIRWCSQEGLILDQSAEND